MTSRNKSSEITGARVIRLSLVDDGAYPKSKIKAAKRADCGCKSTLRSQDELIEAIAARVHEGFDLDAIVASSAEEDAIQRRARLTAVRSAAVPARYKTFAGRNGPDLGSYAHVFNDRHHRVSGRTPGRCDDVCPGDGRRKSGRVLRRIGSGSCTSARLRLKKRLVVCSGMGRATRRGVRSRRSTSRRYR